MNVGLMPLVALTVMLWLLWSESLRKRPVSRIFYFIRTLLYLAMTGVLIFNLLEYPEMFRGGAKSLAILAAVVGLIGAGFFFRQATARRKAPAPTDSLSQEPRS